MGCERLAHTVLRRDTLLKTSEHRWQSTEFPCPARDTGCAILERRGWSPTLGFGPTVTSHDRCLATRPSGQGTQEGARPGTSAARAAPHRLLDRQMLHSESDCIYEVSRTEPFRLRHVRASDAPVTPALINRTVTTILGIMEPGQPHLGREFCEALRTVTLDAPIQLRYQSTHHGVIRVTTIFDLGPDHDRLYVHCSTNDFGDAPPTASA
jgi:hypothetical protein